MGPEQAHHVLIEGMSLAKKIPGIRSLMRSMYGVSPSPELSSELWGIHFPNPIGLAAGMDKDAQAVPMFSSIGFGFIEVGTVTPKPQPGNEQPRVFRLPTDSALINRMGFNNKGAEAMAESLQKVHNRTVPVAVNIGKNKNTPNEQAADDYQACIRQLYPYGNFFVVNISSPNTPDLRKLQHGEELSSLLSAVMEEMNRQKEKYKGSDKPVLVKIAPDLDDPELESIINTIMKSGVSGVIATNTTLAREGLTHRHAVESGGLSGLPMKERSTEVIRKIYKMTAGKLPIIGSGGVFSSEDAYEKIRAGACLVEVYTGLIYEGPYINKKLNKGLRELLKQDGFTHISQAVGADH